MTRPPTAALILAVLSLASLATVAFPDERPIKALSKDVEQILAWLPTDTESLVVARSFELGNGLAGLLDAKVVDLKPLFFDASLVDLRVQNDRLKSPLPQKKVKLAVAGGRNADIVSAFGSVRKESCAIAVLEEALEDAEKWKAALRASAVKTRTIAAQEVFVFPSIVELDRPHDVKEWQGTYVVVLSPDTILCASSDQYLEELLQRRKSPGKDRALPADLPEWKLIDATSPAWMLWRPAAHKDTGVHGGGWMWRDDVAEFVYLPDGDLAVLERAWHGRWGDSLVFPRPKPGESLTQRRDGALVVKVSTKEVGWQHVLLLAIYIGAFETKQLER
jgi:hypothetical protein